MEKDLLMAERQIAKVRQLLVELQLDGVLLRKRRSFSWLTGGRVHHIVNTMETGVVDLIVFPDRLVCIATKMEAARIHDEELRGLPVEMVTPEWMEGHERAIADLTQGLRIGTDVLPQSVAGLADGRDVSRQLAELSYVLSDEEIVRYRRLSQTAARAVESTCWEIETGMTEHEIHAHLAPKLLREGINPQVVLVATDERIYNYRHPLPTAKVWERYAMIVLCAEQGGLVSNVTRFVHFGPLSEEVRANKQKLAEIDLAMNLATRPGTAIADVFATGLQAYQAAGHGDDWRYLHQGGPTGYASREFLATPDAVGFVQENQAFAWNPAIRGIKSEDTLLVGRTENEFLTHTDDWVYIMIEREGKTYKRPDVLVR